MGCHFSGNEEITGAEDGHGGGHGQGLEVVHVDGRDGIAVLLQSNAVTEDDVNWRGWCGVERSVHVAEVALQQEKEAFLLLQSHSAGDDHGSVDVGANATGDDGEHIVSMTGLIVTA